MVVCKFLPQRALVALVSMVLLASCFHKKYETPITKDTQQPDKVLFDQAIRDIEHGKYEVARISLQTLMNTYESSEYLAKAKLAIADSWYREGGPNGLAQAEAEYKDFKLFYPNMPEAAEAQNRVCDIHYKQMDKSDRDWSQTLRAEEECRTLLVEFPNSKFAPVAAQRLRNIQESLAEHEFVVGTFYHKHDMNPAAANRLDALVQQYPLYSKADEALYEAGDSYSKMGPRFRQKAGEMFARIVREYPLSGRADDAKRRLEDMEMPVPQVDQTAYARMKYEQENYRRPGLLARSTRFLRSSPDVSHAAKSGQPTMTDPKPTIPASVPVVSAMNPGGTSATGTGTTDVTATPVGGSSALDKNPDARSSGGAAATAEPNQGLPTNRDAELKKLREKQAKQQKKLQKKKNKEQQGQQPSPAPATSTNGAPASSNPAASSSATPPTPSQNPPQME